MVFAVAALLFQVTAIAPAMTAASYRSGAAEASAAEGDARAVTTTSESVDTTNAQARASFENIKLADQPAFADNSTSTAPLKTMAFNAPLGSLATIRIPELNPSKQAGIKFVEKYPTRKAWLALAIVQHAASAFDAYSTRYAVSRGAVEDDPLMRPFAQSPSIYVVSQLCPAALDFVGRRMQRSENNFIRHMWWLPQTTSSGMYLLSGVHNMRVAGQVQ